MLAPDVRELTFELEGGCVFTPGQWVSLRIPQPDGAVLSRSYSIASAPRADGRFDLAVTLVPGGPGSTWLHAMSIGDAVQVADPMGFFTMPSPLPGPALLVATGTGVAPFRAMLQSLAAREEAAPVTLLLGVRTEADVIYGDEFRALVEARPTVRFEPTLSRGSEAWKGRRGYVQTHVPELVAALGEGAEVYVCGLSAMIRDVRRVLKEDLGFSRERIHTERYD